MSFFEIMQKALMAGLGMQEKLKEFIDELVKKGELSKTQGAKLIKEWSDKAGASKKEFDKDIKEFLSKAVEKINIPTKDEVSQLKKEVQTLSKRLKKLEGQKTD